MTAPKFVNVAIVGLGRIGRYHSMNIIKRIPGLNLVAGCSIVDADIVWAEANLKSHGVSLFRDYDVMLETLGTNIDMVLIATSSSVHATQTISAIERGYHVFCEKPLATTVEDAELVAKTAKMHPEVKVLCGFSRRFDNSYRDAKEKIDAGLIGRPSVFRSQTCDLADETGFFVQYAKYSGGILVDCSIHDLDLALYFFGDDVEPKTMSAIGITAIHPELNEWNDSDNALAIIKFHDGRMASFYASRMMAHGQDDFTEIIGTHGKIAVNRNPQINLTSISDSFGSRTEVPKHFYERYEMAYVNEITAFAEYIVENKPVPFSLNASVKSLKWGKLLQECLQTSETIHFDTSGRRL